MPQLLVVTDLPEAGGEVVYRERIVSSDFESEHFTGQLAERLGWAVHDADALATQATQEEVVSGESEPAEARDQPAELDEAAPPGLTVLAC